MKKFIVFFLVIFSMPVYAKTITGEIKKETRQNFNQIYDNETNTPIEGVIIKIPSKKYETKTNKDGVFKLQTKITSPTIMSVEKSGYKPYSLTLSDNNKSSLHIGIEKTTPNDIIIDTKIIHLGDNSFSVNSANASEFSLSSSGAFYSKDIKLNPIKSDENLSLVIGSIIGIDTIQAQRLNQSRVVNSYASAPEVFFNGNKIAEIKINGDNQKIYIPKGLIKQTLNNITIKAGRNLYKTSNVDYDDIEFANLLFEIK